MVFEFLGVEEVEEVGVANLPAEPRQPLKRAQPCRG